MENKTELEIAAQLIINQFNETVQYSFEPWSDENFKMELFVYARNVYSYSNLTEFINHVKFKPFIVITLYSHSGVYKFFKTKLLKIYGKYETFAVLQECKKVVDRIEILPVNDHSKEVGKRIVYRYEVNLEGETKEIFMDELMYCFDGYAFSSVIVDSII